MRVRRASAGCQREPENQEYKQPILLDTDLTTVLYHRMRHRIPIWGDGDNVMASALQFIKTVVFVISIGSRGTMVVVSNVTPSTWLNLALLGPASISDLRQ
jgi:hypothetical protein